MKITKIFMLVSIILTIFSSSLWASGCCNCKDKKTEQHAQAQAQEQVEVDDLNDDLETFES